MVKRMKLVVFALAAVFLMNPLSALAAPAAPVIMLQSGNIAAAMNERVSLFVVAEAADGGALTYQWFKTAEPVNRFSDDIQIIGNDNKFMPAANTGGVLIEGATASMYTPPTQEPGVSSYYAEVSNGGSKTVSAAVTVAVKPAEDAVKILFVCGGNTGRSPMARVIAEDIFARKGIPAIFSDAGSDIIDGDRAEANAAILMKQRGFDLSQHVAKWWTPQMLQEADLVFVMSGSHKNRLNVPTLGIYSDKIFLFREFVGDSGSVSDPFEQPMEAYIETADMLTDAITKLADQLSDPAHPSSRFMPAK